MPTFLLLSTATVTLFTVMAAVVVTRQGRLPSDREIINTYPHILEWEEGARRQFILERRLEVEGANQASLQGGPLLAVLFTIASTVAGAAWWLFFR